VANQVEQQKAPAGPADIADELPQVAFTQMMAEIHAEGDISGRKTIGNAIGGDNLGPIRGGRRLQIHADRLHTESALHFLENATATAADIEHAANGERIFSNGCDNRTSITKKTVNARKLAVSAGDLRFGDSVAVQELAF